MYLKVKLGACQSPVDEGDDAPTGYLEFYAFRRRDGDGGPYDIGLFFIEFVLISNFFINARATDVDDTYTLYRGGVRGAVTERSVPRRRPRAEQRDPIPGLPRVPAAAPPPRATGDERDEAPTVRRLRAQPAARADPRSPVRVNSPIRPRRRTPRGARFSERSNRQSDRIDRTSNRAERREQIIQRHVNTLQVPIVTHACSVC